MLRGEIRLLGGTQHADIEHVAVGFHTRIETEHGDQDGHRNVAFHRVQVGGRFPLPPGVRHGFAFELPVPWETPITSVQGQHLHGMRIGVRTELAVARAIDQGDLDPVAIEPLPAQDQVLAAFARLGFRFRGADLEQGRLRRVQQQLPFYQEIEFLPPPQFQGRISEVELTFVASPHELTIVLEADKRAGLLRSGGDTFGRFVVPHSQAYSTDWAGLVHGWLDQVAHGDRQHGHRPQAPHLSPPGPPPQPHGHPGRHGFDGHGHPG